MEKLPTIRCSGDSAVTVEFENEISLQTNQKVLALRDLLEKERPVGVLESVPTYRSLMVHFDPCRCSYEEITRKLQKLAESIHGIQVKKGKFLRIPVCYGGAFGPDLSMVAEFEHISPEEVIRRHSQYDCYVYMLGFSPGNAYIGSETPTFSVPRKDTPRVKIPRGAITIWQSQTTIFPMEQPGGWNVIGQTPLAMFLPDKKQPFFLHAGQWVHFYSIDEKTYDTISAAVANGTYRPEYAG